VINWKQGEKLKECAEQLMEMLGKHIAHVQKSLVEPNVESHREDRKASFTAILKIVSTAMEIVEESSSYISSFDLTSYFQYSGIRSPWDEQVYTEFHQAATGSSRISLYNKNDTR
jgi:hypothetical protein